MLLSASNAFSFDPLFDTRIDYGVGEGPYSVCAADLDGDGDSDLAVANYCSDNVSILLNTTTIIVYTCGDANADEAVNVGDAVFLINYAFKGGPAPDPLMAGDASCDYAVNVGDAVYLINYAFKGGPDPCASCP